MSTSEIHSSPAAQWLQGLLANGAPSQAGKHSNTGSAELPRDSTRISARAFQLNQAAGASSIAHARPTQSLGVSAAHQHRHLDIDDKKSDTSFVSSMAQPTLSHPQRSIRIDTLASSNNTGSSTAPSVSYDHERASKIANDLRVAYSHVTAPEAGPSPHYTGTRSISMLA